MADITNPMEVIMQSDIAKAREYHFKNMHVYVNSIFKSVKALENRPPYHHYDPRVITKNHKVHIYMWSTNTYDENIQDMVDFITIVNRYTQYPVYIHMPKRAVRIVRIISSILRAARCDNNPLRYVMIVEKNSNVTQFKYGDFIPQDGTLYAHKHFPNASLLVGWDYREFAVPIFYDEETKRTEHIFTN